MAGRALTEKAPERVLDWLSGLVTVTSRAPRVAVALIAILAVSWVGEL